MRKFILIDQSIKDARGHHLEYALRVLKAAKNLGFQSVLGTHKNCEDVVSEHIDVVDKAFSHSFWENFQVEFTALGPEERRFVSKWKTKKNQLLYDLMCSPLGFSYMAAAQGLCLQDLFSRYGSTTSGKRLSVAIILAGYLLARLNGIRRKIANKFSHFSSPIERIRHWMLMVFIVLICIVFSPILIPYTLVRWSKLSGRSDSHAAQFAEDIQHLLVRVNAASGDIVFIPTLGNVELIGSAICAERLPITNLSWHFLFRRNIFQGREPSYTSQNVAQVKTLQAFSACKVVFSHGGGYFYTDTDALTEQYNRLGLFEFTTLPIPLDDSLRHTKAIGKRQTNIAYIGDARDEKGFPLLARLAADLCASGYLEKDVKFTIQSNFNVPGGEPGSRIAKSELAVFSHGLLTLIEGPFTSKQYTAFVNQADILLFPYDANNYYARSSGGFAEALAAGIPVVTTEKSWMSQELLSLNQNYYRQLLDTNKDKIIQSTSLHNPHIHSRLLLRPRSSGDFAWVLLKVDQQFAQPGWYMHVRWKSSPDTIMKANKTASFFRQFTVDLRTITSFSLLFLPNKGRLLLEFQIDDGLGNLDPIEKSVLAGISIVAHELDLPADTPLFRAASLYSIEEDFFTAAVEVIEKHDQYLRHSQELKKTWRQFHDSEILVKLLDRISK